MSFERGEDNRIQSYIRILSRDVLIYGTGRVIIPLISIVTLPILTRIFTPSDYGVIEGVATISSVFALFSTLMLESSAQRSYYDYKDSEEFERKRVISTSFWTLIIWNLLFMMSVLPFAAKLGRLLFSNEEYGLLILISLGAIPGMSVYNFLKEIFRLRNQPVRYSFYTVISALLSTILIILLVAVFKIGLVGYFLGALIGSIVIAPAVVWSVRENILRVFSRVELKKMLHYGLPLIPTNCSIWVLTLSDRFFLLKFTSLKEVGLYAIGVKLTQVILLFVTAFGLAWGPFILSIYSRDKEEEKRVRGEMVTYYIFILGFLAVFITAFSRPIILFLTTKDFLDAYKVIGILALATAASGASQALCTGINIARKTKYLAIYTGIAAFLNIILNAILIPFFGFIGAAIATAISYYVLCIVYYKKSQELYFSPYEPEKIIKIGILSCLVTLAGTLIWENDLFTELLIKTLLFVSFPCLCLMWNVFDKHEIYAFKALLLSILRLKESH